MESEERFGVTADFSTMHSELFTSVRASPRGNYKRWALALVFALVIEGGLLLLAFAFWRAPAVELQAPVEKLVAVMFQERKAPALGVPDTKVGGPEPVSAVKPKARKKIETPAVGRVVEAPRAEDATVALQAAAAVVPVEAATGSDDSAGIGGKGDGEEQASTGAGEGEGGGSPIGVLEGRDLSRYGVLVLSELAANKRYPMQARRMRLQGIAVVELRVAGDGSLLSVRLMSSSGHEVLDQDAVKLVQDSAPFPPTPGLLPATFKVPIRYGG